MLARLPLLNIPNRPVKLGILANPKAGREKNKKFISSLAKESEKFQLISSTDIGQIDRSLRQLLIEKQCNTVAILGGDGTINSVVNGIAKLIKKGEISHFPPLLLLRGGTLNMLARALNVEGPPEKLLKSFTEQYLNRRLYDLPIKEIPLLAVKNGENVRYGFIFGSQLTVKALELYEDDFGGGYLGLAKFLQAVTAGYITKNRFWRENIQYLNGPPQTLRTENREFLFNTFVATTVDIKLMGGLICGLSAPPPAAPPIAVRILQPQSPGQLVKNLPNLLFGRPGPNIVDLYTHRLTYSSENSFSLEGERIKFPPDKRKITDIYLSPFSVPFVAPFP